MPARNTATSATSHNIELSLNRNPFMASISEPSRRASKGMKQDRTEPKGVGGRTDFRVFPQPLLGCHIARVASVWRRPAVAISPHDRSKVHQLGHAPATEYDVGRLGLSA